MGCAPGGDAHLPGCAKPAQFTAGHLHRSGLRCPAWQLLSNDGSSWWRTTRRSRGPYSTGWSRRASRCRSPETGRPRSWPTRRPGPTWWCSTGCSPGSTGLRCAAGCRRPGRCRCSCSPRSARRPTCSWGSGSGPTTTWPSRSACVSWSPGCTPCCAGWSGPPSSPPATRSSASPTSRSTPPSAGSTCGARRRQLTRTEFDLLCRLAERPGQVFERERLLADIWGFSEAAATRTVDSHVRALRRKLGPGVVRTVHGVGYALSSAPRVRAWPVGP